MEEKFKLIILKEYKIKKEQMESSASKQIKISEILEIVTKVNRERLPQRVAFLADPKKRLSRCELELIDVEFSLIKKVSKRCSPLMDADILYKLLERTEELGEIISAHRSNDRP